MSYDWTTGEVITADKLNATGGFSPFIVNVTYNDSDESFSSDKTYSQVLEALNNGMFVLYLIMGGDGCSLSISIVNFENKILVYTCDGVDGNDMLQGRVYTHDSNGFTWN